MAKIEQLPGELHVEIVQGDAWMISLDFNLDLTNYTIAATLHRKDGTDVVMPISDPNLPLGQFTVSLPATESAATPAGFHRWCLVLTHPPVPPNPPRPRTVVAGRFVVTSC